MLSQQCFDVLNGVTSSSDAADLITCSVGAARIAYTVSMIPVCVLQTCITIESIACNSCSLALSTEACKNTAD